MSEDACIHGVPMSLALFDVLSSCNNSATLQNHPSASSKMIYPTSQFYICFTNNKVTEQLFVGVVMYGLFRLCHTV